MRFGVVVLPGSTCEYDCVYVLKEILQVEAQLVHWECYKDISKYNCIILPGGFSYGDYLRAGAIASRLEVVDAIRYFAEGCGIVLGICNGFQVLTEAGLLEGALLGNTSGKFICKFVYVRVENFDTPFTNACKQEILYLPIAHREGRYYADTQTLNKLKENKQILLRYCDSNGNVTSIANPNGSIDNIAAICNEKFNICGMMPHPERACEQILTSTSGMAIFESIVRFIKKRRV